MDDEQQECSHVGCLYHSNGASRANRAICYAAHERNLRRHLAHFLESHATCPKCIALVNKGQWTMQKARELEAGATSSSYQKDYSARDAMALASQYELSSRESRASRRRGDSRRRGGERGARMAKSQSIEYSTVSAKRPKQMSQATKSPYGRTKIGLSLQSKNLHEMRWALDTLTNLVYKSPRPAGDPAADAALGPKATLQDLSPSIIDDLLLAIQDLCLLDDLHALVGAAADAAYLPPPRDTYLPHTALEQALEKMPNLRATLARIRVLGADAPPTTDADADADADADDGGQADMVVEDSTAAAAATTADAAATADVAAPPNLDTILELVELQTSLGTFNQRHGALRSAFNVLRFLSLEPANVKKMAAHAGLLSLCESLMPKLPDDIIPLAAEMVAQIAPSISFKELEAAAAADAEDGDGDGDAAAASATAGASNSAPAASTSASKASASASASAVSEANVPILVPALVSLLHTSDDVRTLRAVVEALASLAFNPDNDAILELGPDIYTRTMQLVEFSGVKGLMAVVGLRLLNAMCALGMAPRVAIANIPGVFPLLFNLLDPKVLATSYVPFAVQQLLLNLAGAPANRAYFRSFTPTIYALAGPSSPFHDLAELVISELAE